MYISRGVLSVTPYTLPTDELFNLEFNFESVLNLEFQPKFGIQLRIPIPMGMNLGECMMIDGKLFMITHFLHHWNVFSKIA